MSFVEKGLSMNGFLMVRDGKTRLPGARRGIAAAARWALPCLISLLMMAEAGKAIAGQATTTWSGGGADGNWSSAANWASGTAPTAGNNTLLLFTGTTRTSSTNNYAANSIFRQIAFGQSAGTFTLSGSAITLGNNAANCGIVNNSSNLQTVNLAGIVLAVNATPFESGSAGLTVSSPISGAFSLSANSTSTGTLTFSGSNSFSGGLTVGSGVMRATTSANALGAGTLTLAGGDLELANDTGLNFARNTTISATTTILSDRLTAGAGVTHTLGTLSIGAQALTLATDASVTSGTAGLTFGAVTLSAGGATFNADAGTLLTLGGFTGNTFGFTVGGAGNTTITGAIATTTGTLGKTGSGRLTLSAANTFTGGVALSGGTLAFGIANSLSTNAVTISNGATLDIASFSDSTGTITLTSGNIVGTTGTLSSSANFATTSGTISATLGGTNFGIAQGSGTTVVTSSNAFTGGSTIASGGVLNLRNAFALGTTGTATVSSGGALELQNSGTLARVLSLNGTGISSGGALRNVSGTNGISAAITLAGATRITSDANLLTLSGTTISGTFGLTFGGAGNITVSNTIATGTNNLTKDGAGTLTLSAANTYSGTTSVSAGVLNVQNSSALGTSSGTVAAGAELQLQGGITINRPLTLSGTGVSGNGALRSISGANTYSGTITTAALIGVGVDSGTLTLSGSLGGGNQFVKYGSGLLVLTGTDGITGAHTINSGTFQIGAGGVLAPGGGVVMNVNNATFDLNGRNATIGTSGNPIASLTGGLISTASGTLSLFSTGTFATLTTNASANSSTISGNLSLGGTNAVFTVNDGAATDDLVVSAVISNGGFTKNGAGKMKLTGTNTYGGATTVSAGTLLLGANSVLSGSTAVTVNGGVLDNGGFTNSVASFTITSGTYQGAGTLTAGTYALGGGTVTGTLGAGTLNVATNSSLDGSSNASTVNLNAGTLTLGGANVLSSTATVTGSAGGSLALGGNQTIGSISGPAGVALGSNTLTVGGLNTSTTYSGTMNGAGGLTKVGSGTFTLSAANAYGGATTVNAGVLALGASNALSGSTAVTVGGGGLNLATFNPSVAGFTITSGSLFGSGTLTAPTYALGGGSVATTLGSGTVNVSAGTTLSGTALAGTVNINTGTLSLTSANALSSSAIISGSAGGGLSLGGNQTIGSLAGGADIALGANTLTTGGNNSNTSLSGGFTGTGNLKKVGSGTFTLSGNSSFSGTASIENGAISVGSVASGSTNQPLGTGNTLNLGAAGSSSGRLVYTGSAGTLSKNVNALGNGTDTIQNAGSGLLTLSGTLTKNGTILRLQGGSQGITVTGQITGTSQNSDLAVQNGLTTLSTTNSYVGPTFINSSGTLALGISNAIPSNSAVTIGGTFADGNGGAGTLHMGTFTNAVGSLAFSGSGGMVKMAPTASATSTVVLSATGAVNLAGTTTLDLTGMATGAGRYQLIAGSSLTDTFDTVTGLDTNYVLRYGTLTAGQLDAQRKADQATTFTMTTGAVTRALVNTNVTLSGTIANSSPVNSTALSLGLGSTGQLTVANFTSGSVTAGSSLAVSGSVASGSTVGSRSWTVVNTDTSAITTTSTATGTLDVVNQRVFTTSTSTLVLGFIHQGGAIGSPTVVVTSTGLNAVTANASLGSFAGGPGGFSLATNDSTTFNGGSASQSATYTLAGPTSSLGAISGTFSSAVSAELGSINNVTVAVTGDVYSGLSTWATNGGGNWGTFASGFGTNWGTNQGSPGLDAAFANTDTATFGSALTGGTAAINTNGATISLKSLTFDTAAGSYEIYQTGGSGGMTLLAGGTNAAGITVTAGSHAIHSDLMLGSNTVVDVASGAAFTFHNAVSGSAAYGLTKTGLGTLFFNGNSTYAGNTTITQGVVSLLSGVNPLGTGTVTVSSGATLDFNFRTISNVLNVLSGGILLNTGSGQTTTVSDQVFFNGTTNGTVNVTNGGSAVFQSTVGALVTVNSGGFADFTSQSAGTPTVNVLSGGVTTVSGTAAGSYQVAGTGTFSGRLTGDLDVASGGVVAFNGSNGGGSTFNVAAGGLANVASAASIGGQLHVSGSAVIAGSVASNADVIVQSGGSVKLVDGASFAQTNLNNAGTFIVDRGEALSIATAINGAGGLTKTGTGALTLTGANTFTGPTSLDAGKLLVNGSLASDVATAAGSTLGGSGSIAGTLSGAGLVSPGNSPGILTAGVFDPTGGLDAAFEFTELAPIYGSGTASGNDVLRLTSASPFVASLGGGNTIDVYFNVDSLSYNQAFTGGFFTTQSQAQLLEAVQNADFQFWFKTTDGGFTRTFNGVNYKPLNYTYSEFSGALVQTRQVTADFGAGPVTGVVTEYVVVPEPGSLALAGVGIAYLVCRYRSRRSR